MSQPSQEEETEFVRVASSRSMALHALICLACVRQRDAAEDSCGSVTDIFHAARCLAM
jgi:hypothetical protein